MANKFGFNSVQTQLNLGTSQDSGGLQDQFELLNKKVIYARVVDIILNDQHPEFVNLGGWSGLGTIFYNEVEGASTTTKSVNTALPLLPYLKNYPLVNELVVLLQLPSKKVNEQSNVTQYYYLNPISIWNSQHINAFPNVDTTQNAQNTERKSYTAIEEGQTRKSTSEEVNYDYNSPLVGGTFEERSNISPLLPFAGDIITEGRWGNSIRLGSTAKVTSGTFVNNWSNNGSNGDPITIIRNGQPIADEEQNGWVPIVENINEDQSSIYLTSHQTIPLNASIGSNPSIKNEPPETISSYSGSQVILNSDRLIFNTKADSMLISSQQHISITANKTVGILSTEGDIVLQTNKNNVRLGDPNANQSVILGDKFLDEFTNVLLKLQILCQTLTTEPLVFVSSGTAAAAQTQISLMLNNMNKFKSDIVKTV